MAELIFNPCNVCVRQRCEICVFHDLAVRSIEAEPVKHGRWVWKPIDERISRLFCSVCESDDGACETYCYCPNCGAKMDGGAENE